MIIDNETVPSMVYPTVMAQWATESLWNIPDLRTHLQVGGRVFLRCRSLEYTAQDQTAPNCYQNTGECIAALIQ